MNSRHPDSFFIILFILLFYATQSWAETWQHSMTARISEIYDTNPVMSPTSQGEVTRAVFEPGYSLLGHIGDSELKVGLALLFARSSNETLSPMRNNPTVFLDWSQQVDSGEFGLLYKYAEIATRDSAIDTTGLEPVTSTRSLRHFGVKINNTLSERSSLAADGSLEKISYSGGGNYIDYNLRSVSIGLNYLWTEQSTPFIKLSHSTYEPEGGGSSNQLDSADFGLTWKTSDNLEGTLQGGRAKNGNDEFGTQGAAALQYTGQRSTFAINAGRQILPSGIGGFFKADQANTNWSYTLNERNKTGIDFGWRNNHVFTDIIYRTGTFWLQHDLDPLWLMRAYCQRNVLQRAGMDDAASNMVGITLAYSYSDF